MQIGNGRRLVHTPGVLSGQHVSGSILLVSTLQLRPLHDELNTWAKNTVLATLAGIVAGAGWQVGHRRMAPLPRCCTGLPLVRRRCACCRKGR